MKKIEADIEVLPLSLPIRYENLEREIVDLGLNLSSIIQKVESATDEVERLLKQINHGKNGKFKLFFAKTGTGKTTFLKTLDSFFINIEIVSIGRETPLTKIPKFIIDEKPKNNRAIFIIEDRDNPNETEEDLRIFFEDLRYYFRKDLFDVLVIWPITNSSSAKEISEIAWGVGGDSITSPEGCIYNFKGLSNEKYYKTADITCKSLNGGKNLECFGITKEVSQQYIEKSSSIGSFYSYLTDVSLDKIKFTESYLKNIIKPKVWILLPGDEATEIDRTVKSLTSGVKYRLDVERILAILDNPKQTSNYLKDWRTQRSNAAYFLQTLDVRLLPIPPNISLACIRAFGSAELKSKLKNSKGSKEKAIDEIKKSVFYQLLFDDVNISEISLRKTTEKTSNEYLRIQKEASKNDKLLNKALGQGIEEALKSDNVDAIVHIEKKSLKNTNLQPDIQIQINDSTIICLEPTWRTTGRGIVDEMPSGNNSLALGDIQRYSLDKVMAYLKSLNL